MSPPDATIVARLISATRPALLAACLTVIACGNRCWSEVVVSEFPREENPPNQRSASGNNLKSSSKTQMGKPSRSTAAEYLSELRQATRRSQATDRSNADSTDGEEIKLDLIPAMERQERTELGYRRLYVPKGTYGVEGHGTGLRMKFKNGLELTADEMARWIRNDPRYTNRMTVYLLACETGKGTRPFAQELADALQAKVYAPTEKLWIHRDGTYSVYPGASQKLTNGAEQSSESAATGKPGMMKAFHPSLAK